MPSPNPKTTTTSTQAANDPTPRFRNGDGTSKDTAAWGPSFTSAFASDPTQRGVVVDRRGVSPRFVRETRFVTHSHPVQDELGNKFDSLCRETAVAYAGMGYDVFYDGVTGERMVELPDSCVDLAGSTGGAGVSA